MKCEVFQQCVKREFAVLVTYLYVVLSVAGIHGPTDAARTDALSVSHLSIPEGGSHGD